MKRLILVFSICFLAFSSSSPALAAKHHEPRLTKAEAHKATEVRLRMLKQEWPEVIVSYTIAPAKDCKRFGVRIGCSYQLTNNPEGVSQPIVCSGLSFVRLNYRNAKNINVGVTLGDCESSTSTAWVPTWY